MSRTSGIQPARAKADRRKTTHCGPPRLPARQRRRGAGRGGLGAITAVLAGRAGKQKEFQYVDGMAGGLSRDWGDHAAMANIGPRIGERLKSAAEP